VRDLYDRVRHRHLHSVGASSTQVNAPSDW
jgi:hypothetical protein